MERDWEVKRREGNRRTKTKGEGRKMGKEDWVVEESRGTDMVIGEGGRGHGNFLSQYLMENGPFPTALTEKSSEKFGWKSGK